MPRDIDKKRAYDRAYHVKNGKKRNEQHRAWRRANRDKVSAWNRRYRKNHPDVVTLNNDRRIRAGDMYLGMCGTTPNDLHRLIEDINNATIE